MDTATITALTSAGVTALFPPATAPLSPAEPRRASEEYGGARCR
jgi:hypothetical protein